jgi:protein ImuB
MLWLSLYFHHLSLDIFMRGGPLDEPLAIYAHRGNRQWIHDRNRAAASLGINPGMSLGASLSLSNQLQTRLRDEEAEIAALKNIAIWAEQFTPTISLQPPEGVLLEIEGSLTLFGGIEALRKHIELGLKGLGYHARIAVAPTPSSAWLLSRIGCEQPITDKQSLARILRQQPISVLERSERILHALQNMGLRTIGDCLHLPRAGLARRLGPEFIHYLDRILGRVADPRTAFKPPACFESRLMLPAEVTSTEALLFAARRLILELTGFLQARGFGVQELLLELFHHNASPSPFTIGLVSPARDADHLLNLLRERLEHYALPSPVDAIRLSADNFQPLSSPSQDLFTETNSDKLDWPQLVERLRARLGRGTVKGLCLAPDYRPERAWRYCHPGEGQIVGVAAHRPLWLLEEPTPLEVKEEQPWLDGKLIIEQGPERIESGWWEDVDVARDYFIAENPRYERFWIFRELRNPGRWFLHGIFA